MESHTGGGCHIPDYWAAAQILDADIQGSDEIPMGMKATMTSEDPTVGVPMCSTSRTGGGGIGFILKLDLPSHRFPFIGQFPPGLTCRPLMDLLIGFLSIVEILSDVPHIAYDQRMHTACVECGYRVPG